MKRNYATEISTLHQTYTAALGAVGSSGITEVLSYGGPIAFSGSGGALAVAQLAADLHTANSGELALAATPLSLASAHHNPDIGLVLFSASGRHPDSALVMESARRRGATHLGLVTTRLRSDLPPALSGDDITIATVPSDRDGFLATNSLLSMAVAICAAHGAKLPETLPAFQEEWAAPLRQSCLVLTAGGAGSIAIDLEARLTETGLSSVQMADYRNVAHGRHVGLMRNEDRTTVIAISDAQSEALAERTLALFPRSVDVRRLHSPLDWPLSMVDLLVRSMCAVAATGEALGVDPGQPGVPAFGRRLYHLPVRRLAALPQPKPVLRKAGHDRRSSTLDALQVQLTDWIRSLRRTRIGGLVVDYDGTVCTTWNRFELPSAEVQSELLRLLDDGLSLGFASGRGRSLLEMTRRWVPEKYWHSVDVGLYNGAAMMTLADDPEPDSSCLHDLEIAASRLEELGLGIAIERRHSQLSITARGGDPSQRLRALVQSVVARHPALACKVVASGHSVDVVPAAVGKTDVLRAVQSRTTLGVIAIGDQGQVGGNDFELLSSSPLSLSVDRCSADPSRCWNLDVRGERGPVLLQRYLSSIRARDTGFVFEWKQP